MRNKIGVTLVMIIGVMMINGCRQNEEAAASQPVSLPLVSVETLLPQAVTIESTWPARINALQTAQIRPQVGGIVTARLFSQGSEVVAGQPLFQIDPAPFKADVEMAEAVLARSEAAYRQLNLRAQRLKKLEKNGAISQQDYDDAQANAAQAAASIAEAKASLTRKKLDLAYSTIRAPISGRIDQQFITEGALVSAADSQAMATVQQTGRVYVDARLPAAELRNVVTPSSLRGDHSTTHFVLLDENGRPFDVNIKLLFSGTSVNDATGDVVLRAEAENPQRELMPGMYSRLKIVHQLDDNQIVIPEQAIQREEDRSFVWVIDEQNKAERKQIQLGAQTTLGQVVENGLQEGQKLVIEGQDKLHEGMEVRANSLKTKA
ncbi:efflux RND transporter periplasmic adaptor subunit [Citrobacter sp. JGM124]|uniref:efflux RND transporter periplasmic adaptor subunit n=1 Tax=Citrobacter sp. JGM124 TaxID=2799789 RepID=UPI001BAD5000|nr:efflux RND transporter periplasmic adaptor subunit [Citrobacter sp. JGM124]